MPNRAANRRPPRPGLWVGALTGVLFLLAASLGRPPTATDSGAGAYLPADGFRVRYTTAAGSSASEWATGDLFSLTNSGPIWVYSWPQLANLAATTATARLSTVKYLSDGQVAGREDTFFSIDASGIRTGLETSSTGRPQVYVPGRLDLPSQNAAGRSWVSDGRVIDPSAPANTAPIAYHAEYSAAAPTERADQVRRCLVITMKLTVGTDRAEPSTRTWCPSLGIMAIGAPTGTTRATTDPAAIAVPAQADFDWSSADRLAFSSHTVNKIGTSEALANPAMNPGILDNGLLVAVQKTADSIAVDPSAEPARIPWRVRAGGSNNTAASFGNLTLIVSTNRKLVAYDGDGGWRWASQLSDLAVVPPVRLGELAVVATLDGSVSAYSLASGALIWTNRLGAEIRTELRTRGDRVVAMDQTGTVACFDSLGQQQWSVEASTAPDFAISSGTHPVVVVPDESSPWTIGLSLSNGEQLWRISRRVTPKTMVGLEEQIVIRDLSTTIGLDANTGDVRWAWQGGTTYSAIGGGHRVLILTADRLVLLDDRGHQMREWPVNVGNIAARGAFLGADSKRVVLFGSSAIELGVAQ